MVGLAIFRDASQKHGPKSGQISFPVEVVQHVTASCPAQRPQGRVQTVGRLHASDEIIPGSGAIQESGLSIHDELRNPGDRWSQYRATMGHGLHKHQRDALAATGKYNQVAGAVMRVEPLAAQVPQQSHFFREIQATNQALESDSFLALARDQA